MTGLSITGVDALRNATKAFEVAGARLIQSASGTGDADAGRALADISTAKAQFAAGLATIRFSTAMWDALLQIGDDRTQR
jgi:hypothetical protein